MTAIKEMAGIDVLCSDKTGTLTLNKITVDKTLIEVFVKDTDKDHVVLMGARAALILYIASMCFYPNITPSIQRFKCCSFLMKYPYGAPLIHGECDVVKEEE